MDSVCAVLLSCALMIPIEVPVNVEQIVVIELASVDERGELRSLVTVWSSSVECYRRSFRVLDVLSIFES